MKINLELDLGALVIGVGIGLVAYPFIFDKKKIKKTAAKGAVKEVSKSIFGKKEKKDEQESGRN